MQNETAQRTEFNGMNPLDNGGQVVALDAGGNVELEFDESTVSSLDLENIDLSTQDGVRAALNALDDAQTQINSNRANLGAQQSAVLSTIEERSNASLNLREAESRIRDLDVARAFVEQTRNEVLLQAGVSAIAQGNAKTPCSCSAVSLSPDSDTQAMRPALPQWSQRHTFSGRYDS